MSDGIRVAPYDEIYTGTGVDSENPDPVVAGRSREPDLQRPRRTSWTLAELMATTFDPPNWAVPGLIAEGVNVLAGSPKVGKSWLGMNVALAVSSGGKALGRIDVDPGDVLHLGLEDPGRRLQKRYGAMLAGGAGNDQLTVVTKCEPMDLGGDERIERWIARAESPRLVVVDVLAKVRPRVPDKANAYTADYGAITTMKELADRHGVPFLVVHHTRKMAATDYLDTVSGTQGIAGAADAILILTRSRGAASAVLKVTGRDIEEAEYALDFKPDIGTWQLLEGPAEQHTLSDTRGDIRAFLVSQVSPSRPADVARALGLNPATVRKTMTRMAEDTQLLTDGNGSYSVPGVGVTGVTPLFGDSSDTRDSSDTSDRCDT